MKKKNYFYKFILQFSLIFIILSLFYFERLEANKIKTFLNFKFFYLILFLSISKLIVSLLFSYILKLLTKKGKISDLIPIYLKGGLANEAIPGLGYFYRYKQLNENFSISLTEYSFVQTLNNIFILFSYLILALILGFLTIQMSNLNLLSAFIIFLILSFYTIYTFRFKLFYFEKLKKVYSDISIIKKKIIKNYLKFILLFSLYFSHSIFQCYIFYKLVVSLELDLSFIDTSYIYISSLLMTFLSLTNFIGIFELVLSFTSSFFTEYYIDMWFIGISFRIMGVVSLLLTISLLYFLNLPKKHEKIQS